MCIAAAIIAHTGCALANPEDLLNQIQAELPTVEYQQPDGEYASIEDEGALTEEDLKNLKSVDSYEADVLSRGSEDLYYFRLADEDTKRVYGEILYILTNVEEEIEVSTTDLDVIDRAFNYVLWDHPEIFYVSGYSLMRYLLLGELRSVTFSGQYLLSHEEIEDYRVKIESYVDEYFEALNISFPDGADDYHLIKFAYEYIVLNTDYDLEAPLNQGIASVMVNHLSVCNGYAKSLQYLLNLMGIECTIVEGRTQNLTGHAWNLVKADGDYYYVDSTWGDATFTVINEGNADISSLPPVNYDYLLVTTEELNKTHTLDHPELMPICVSDADYYYLRENLFFTELDKDKLKEVFETAYANNDEYITIKFATRECYDEVGSYLLKEQNIFDYLQNMTSVSYAQNEDRLYMVFWIR